MRKLILVAHISLDGFVAGPNGELDGFDAGEENLEFVCQLTDDADAALFGRKSYELLDHYWPTAYAHPKATEGEVWYSRWYNSATKIIFSRTMADDKSEKKIIIRDNVQEEITAIKNQPGKSILIFGSPSVSQMLMQLGLIDSYWIFVNPVIFGNGISLFAKQQDRTKLRLLETKEFANGEVAMHFEN